MHHHLDKLAGVRLRADVNDEIASENRAISRIEELIDNYVPPTCALCSATAMDSCRWCARPICEDDMAHPDVCVECFVERLTT